MTKWFGAKTVYRTRRVGVAATPGAEVLRAAEAVGTPVADKVLPDDTHATATMVEERVVLFRAGSAELAIERAEIDAKSYASGQAANTYGQQLVSMALEYVEVYEMSSDPEDGLEVFSRTYLCSSEISDDDVVGVLCPDDAYPFEVRELFEPNLAQSARRIAGEDVGDE